MPNLDEFDLDLQQMEEDTASKEGGVSITSDGFCDTDVITSIVHCTRNGQWYSCLCSTCCTSHTAPGSCSIGC